MASHDANQCMSCLLIERPSLLWCTWLSAQGNLVSHSGSARMISVAYIYDVVQLQFLHILHDFGTFIHDVVPAVYARQKVL